MTGDARGERLQTAPPAGWRDAHHCCGPRRARPARNRQPPYTHRRCLIDSPVILLDRTHGCGGSIRTICRWTVCETAARDGGGWRLYIRAYYASCAHLAAHRMVRRVRQLRLCSKRTFTDPSRARFSYIKKSKLSCTPGSRSADACRKLGPDDAEIVLWLQRRWK